MEVVEAFAVGVVDVDAGLLVEVEPAGVVAGLAVVVVDAGATVVTCLCAFLGASGSSESSNRHINISFCESFDAVKLVMRATHLSWHRPTEGQQC